VDPQNGRQRSGMESLLLSLHLVFPPSQTGFRNPFEQDFVFESLLSPHPAWRFRSNEGLERFFRCYSLGVPYLVFPTFPFSLSQNIALADAFSLKRPPLIFHRSITFLSSFISQRLNSPPIIARLGSGLPNGRFPPPL